MAWVRHVRCNQPNNLTELIYLNFTAEKYNFRTCISFVWSFQNVQVNKVRRSTLNLHHFVNAIECILYRILHEDISLTIHISLYYS